MSVRPELGVGQLHVLDSIERAIRGIHHPVDVAECFRLQCHLALESDSVVAEIERLRELAGLKPG